ncbi:MAG: TetR/AcrR family transcriptional regulator [Acidobacteria bacterium]|nr:TetR/AcrR family transcriptional regulator [Acidobacteriota bacterium]MBV9924607.1 TetR/AcrR family transcriptional regulator [Acidobacteriota bacterium]
MTRHFENDPAAPPPHQTAAPGSRMCADDRRRQIAEVAMRLFSERGFRGTTTKEIAQAAGVSEAIIFRHFATKEELYTAIIDYKGCGGAAPTPVAERPEQPHVIDEIRDVVAEAVESGDDLAVFQAAALHMLEHHDEDPEFLRLLMYIALENHSLGSVFWDRNVRVLYEFLGGYVRCRQREGAFREVDAYAAVRVFLGSVIHHSLVNLLWDKDPARRIFHVTNGEAARQFAEILLRGIAADPDSVGAKRKRPARNREAGADVKNHRDKNKKR